MAAPIPTIEPEQIVSGDTATWLRKLPDYLAGDGWSLSYVFIQRNGSGQPVSFNATASGNDHLVNVGPGVTAVWPAGDYAAQGYVTNGTDRFRVWEGYVTILPNFAGANVGDIRSHARKVLDGIQAVLEKRGTQEVLEWTVEGVALRKATVADLLMLRDRYAVMVQKEEAAARTRAGRGSRRRVLTTFVGPGSRNTWPPGFVRS